jgi:hypothetical protein
MKCLAVALSNSRPVSNSFLGMVPSMIANIATRDPFLYLVDDRKSPDFYRTKQG